MIERTREQASALHSLKASGEITILKVRFDRLTRGEALIQLEKAFGLHKARKVYIVNTHTLNISWSNRAYREILNQADLLLNDGTGAQIASRLLGNPFPDNLVGTDLTPLLCERAARRNVGVFLMGGRPDVPERAATKLLAMVPGLLISGTHHGYFPPEEEPSVVEAINRSGAGILLVALGNPLQETWIHRNAPRLTCDVCIGVGGLFDHLSGNLCRAPRWMRRLGIEWVHILLNQPYKWPRYLIGNPLFLARLVRDRLGRTP
jgi:N-acetylglucosaminyldiphosphoundecaprenol N-acetyl-beta-D-mannosaminyltransferase